GGILAIIGVIAAPITSGDTAFRSGRLIVADLFNIKQNSIAKRIAVTLPFFIIAFILLQISFDVIWRYFAWVNQLLATITLWAITAYIIQDKGKFIISLIPALFMTCVCSTYIFIAKTDGFGLEHTLAYSIAAVITIAVVLAFYFRVKKNMNNDYKLD
ncbi:MAG: carbon starvation protein A, partial [Bacteroidetes bacterium]|nr:carbon starvation protein A [Bacteroidota bacterium]